MFTFDFDSKELMKLYDTLNTFGEDFEKQCLEETLKECGRVVADKMKSNIESATNKGYATGEAARKVKATLKKKKGVLTGVEIYPRGNASGGKKNTRGNKLRNMDKICYLEFGTSKESAHPVMQPAISSSQKEVQNIMLNDFKKYAKEKGLI